MRISAHRESFVTKKERKHLEYNNSLPVRQRPNHPAICIDTANARMTTTLGMCKITARLINAVSSRSPSNLQDYVANHQYT